MSPDKIEFEKTWIALYSVALRSNASAPVPEALKVLRRLARRLEMKDAWAQLKHFADVSPSDLLMMTFLVWLLARINRLKRKYPDFEPNRDRKLAAMFRLVTDALRDPAIRAEASISDTTLRELERAAAIYERRVKNSDVLRTIAATPTKAGAGTADQTAFIYQMYDWLGKRRTGWRQPYALIAILVTVVFNRLCTDDRVKQLLKRQVAAKKQAKFGNI
jgi:hypothetical protein